MGGVSKEFHGQNTGRRPGARNRPATASTYDLSCSTFGSHVSPGSAILGSAGACAYAASGRLVGVAGSGGWRGDCVAAGVLRRLAS